MPCSAPDRAVDDALLEAFTRCAADPAADELDLALLVARTIDAGVRARDVNHALDQLAGGLRPGETPWDHLRRSGFDGDVAGYGELVNSNIAAVLARRRGIPITLGVILIHLCRRAGLRAAGVNFPGHFLVEVEDGLVDPFLLAPVDRAQCVERLPAEARGVPWGRLFAPATPLAVGLRMLNNVRLGHARRGAWHQALNIVDAQLRLAPDQPSLHYERGALWRRIGLTAPARAAFESALALSAAGGGEEAQAVRVAAAAQLSALGDANDTLH